MSKDDLLKEIQDMEARIAFLYQDKTVWRMAWAGSTYNHGPYLRKLEIKKLKAKVKRRRAKL
jgi:hypothetical protein